jgi:NAD-dependent SIR2 family protein deacetylase
MKKELFLEMKDAKPNKSHLALAEVEKAGKLGCLITQNIEKKRTVSEGNWQSRHPTDQI